MRSRIIGSLRDQLLKMASRPPEKKEVLSSAAGQLGEWHPSKLTSPHSLNWHGVYQVRQWPVVEGSIILKMAYRPTENGQSRALWPQGS